MFFADATVIPVASHMPKSFFLSFGDTVKWPKVKIIHSAFGTTFSKSKTCTGTTGSRAVKLIFSVHAKTFNLLNGQFWAMYILSGGKRVTIVTA